MRYIVTGGVGFIGFRIVQNLLNLGERVLCIDSLDKTLYNNVTRIQKISQLKEFSNFEYINLDLAKDNLLNLFDSSDVVINEAGLPGQSKSWNFFDDYLNSNLRSVAKLLEACKKTGVKKFIQASTSSVYGKYAVGDETQFTNPCSPYGVTKLAAENLLLNYFESENLPVTILRYFSVYGPGQRPDMAISRFLSSLHNDQPIYLHGTGEQLRDVTYVDDVVSATLSSIESGANGEIYNIAGGKQISINEIISICENVLEKKAQIIHIERPKGDQEETKADISKAVLHLGYQPTENLQNGIFNQFKEMSKTSESLI